MYGRPAQNQSGSIQKRNEIGSVELLKHSNVVGVEVQPNPIFVSMSRKYLQSKSEETIRKNVNESEMFLLEPMGLLCAAKGISVTNSVASVLHSLSLFYTRVAYLTGHQVQSRKTKTLLISQP